MPVRPNAAARNLILTSGLGGFDGADIEYYDGTQPGAGGGSVGAATLLASGTLPTPAFAAASAGARAVASNWEATGGVGITAETAAWARIETAGGAIIDLDVSDTSGALVLDTLTVNEDDIIRVNGGTGITLPGNDA